jgi:hypothetical protein
VVSEENARIPSRFSSTPTPPPSPPRAGFLSRLRQRIQPGRTAAAPTSAEGERGPVPSGGPDVQGTPSPSAPQDFYERRRAQALQQSVPPNRQTISTAARGRSGTHHDFAPPVASAPKSDTPQRSSPRRAFTR